MLQDVAASPSPDLASAGLPVVPLLSALLCIAVLVLAGVAMYRRLLNRPTTTRRQVTFGEHLVVMPGEVRKDGRARLELATTRPSASAGAPELDIAKIPRPTFRPARAEIATLLPLFRVADRARRVRHDEMHSEVETARAEGF